MATRDHSRTYSRLRASHRGGAPVGSGPVRGYDPIQQQSDLEAQQNNSESEWLRIVDSIERDTASITTLQRQLSALHSQRLRVSFDATAVSAQEVEIQSLTARITSLLKACQVNVQRIAYVDDVKKLSQQERQVRINIMKAAANKLTEQSKAFQTSQKKFLSDLRNQTAVDENGVEVVPRMSANERDLIDQSIEGDLTPEQATQLDMIQGDSQARMKEIIQVAQNINELAAIFRSLNSLIVEQGTILDRIDYNVEQTVDKIEQGKSELIAAEKVNKKGLTTKCIGVLILIVGFLLLLVIIKRSAGL